MIHRKRIGWGFSLDNRLSHKRVNFGIKVSRYIQDNGFNYVQVEKDSGYEMITFSKDKVAGWYRLNFEFNGNSRKRTTVYNKEFISKIVGKKPKRLYYFQLDQSKMDKDSVTYATFEYRERKEMDLFKNETKQCRKCGKVLPVSEFYAKGNSLQSYCKDCMKAHGRLRNGTTGEYRKETEEQKTIDEQLNNFTDEQLYNELKRRGYEGKLVKNKVLE